MDIKKQEILQLAIQNLEERIGHPGIITVLADRLLIHGRAFVYAVHESLAKTQYNASAMLLKARMSETGLPGILVGGNISPEVMTAAKADGVFTLDAAGNCEITPAGGPYLSVRGRKNVFKAKAPAASFRAAGLKVLYYLLLDRSNIRQSIREIQAHTDVAVGTVKNVIDALYPDHCFDSKNGRNWKDLHGALERWTEDYNQFLKPKQLLTRLDFAQGKAQDWQEITLPDGMVWGGECGAFLLDSFLFPGSYELYTGIPTSALLRTGKVLPSAQGKIAVYEKFWKEPATGIHPLVIYADLMGTGDGRCREEAQRLLSHELSYIS